MKKLAKKYQYTKIQPYLFHNFSPLKTQKIKQKRNFYKNFLSKTTGFTLVELIIVITILSILATIAFISFKNYSGNARDGNRITTIKNIQTGLELFVMKTGKYPIPEGEISTGTLSGEFSYKGEFGTTLTKQISFNKLPTDPKNNNQNYIYATTQKQNEYQIGTILEGELSSNTILNTTYASTNIYTAKVEGNYKGYAKYQNEIQSCISYVNIPSLIWSNTGIVNLLSTGSENIQTPIYVINKGKNLPYFTESQREILFPDEVVREKTQKDKTKILTICEEDLKVLSDKQPEELNPEEQEIIESFGEEKPKDIKEKILGDNSIPSYASCEGTPHNQTKTFWKEASVNYGNTCEAGIEFTCSNGIWKHETEIKEEYLYSSCNEGEAINCAATLIDGYEIGETEHNSTYTAEKEISIENGSITYKQIFSCNNGGFSKILDEVILSPNCNANYVASENTCVLDTCSGTRPDNSELNGTQGTASWAWSQEETGVCKYKCNEGYETQNCTPKQKMITSASYNSRTFSFTGFTLIYGTPQTKVSNPLTISGGTSTLTSTFTLSSNGIDIVLSAQSENVACNAGFTQVGTDCKRNIVAYDGAKRWSDESYATNCNGYRNPSGNYTYAGAVGDGIYFIKPDTNPAFKVYCDMTTDGGGWIVITNSIADIAGSLTQPFNITWNAITTTGVGDITNMSNNFR